MRRALCLILALLFPIAAGCHGGDRGSEPTPEPVAADPLAGLEPWSDPWIVAHAPSYLGDDRARRAAMEASLTAPENLYSRTRLGSYGRVRAGWDALPEWRPRSRPLDAALVAAIARGERPPVDGLEAIEEGTPRTFAEWAALGERVFHELPLRSEPFWEVALRDPALGEAVGLHRAPDGSVPGLVWMRDLDGRGAIGITCAICHSAPQGHSAPADGAFVSGRARRTLDYGRVRLAYFESHGQEIDPIARARWTSWGPGRADVLEDVADVPIAIPDLWGLRHQRLLTQAGTLTHASPLALAIRQETQYVQANHLRTRPPRALMFALTVYLYSLAPPPPPAFEGTAREREAGGLVFANACGRCHSSAIGSGELVPVAEIGTDPELATGSARGTGGYRPAALVRVADAAPYLHHGAVPSLESLLDPARTEPGHRFGMDLAPADRDLLLRYLRSR